MRVVKKLNISHIYKFTCKEIDLVLNNKYSKKLGTSIINASDIILTDKQILFLLTLNCRGNSVIGYLKKTKNGKCIFLDIIEIYEKYLLLDKINVCKKCLNKLLKNK